MASNDKKRYWYIQVWQVFFDDPVITKLKRMPGGKEALLAYLEILVLAGPTNGVLTWDAARHSSLAEQLSLSLRETTPEEVEAALIYFSNNGYIREFSEHQYELIQAEEMTKSLTGAAIRQQKLRATKEQATEQATMSPITKTKELKTNNKEEVINTTTTTEVVAAVEPVAVDNSNLFAKIAKLKANGLRTNIELLASQYTEAKLDSYIAWAKATAKNDVAGFLFRALEGGWVLPQKYLPKIACPKCQGRLLEDYTLPDGIETTGLCSLCKGKGFIRKETQNAN